jgi:1-acyl-sn-glycerol-3-phosphate acyltransferase
MLLLRSLLFALGMWSALLVIAPLGLLTWPLPFAIRFKVISQWARFNVWWLEKTCGIHYQISGRENIPAGNGIVLCKHQSTWETLVLQQVFPAQVWLLKRELLWVPLFGWALALLEPIAIDRGAGRKALKQLIKQGKEKLAAGRWVIIYPEGTRTAPGQKGHYAPGGAMLAEQSGYPVVPIAHNAGEFWPRRGFIKRPGTIRLVIGPVIESSGRKAQAINTEVEGWIEETMQAISHTAVAADQ